jgi:hypothetical protein
MTAGAATLTIGNRVVQGNSSDPASGTVRTNIDLVHPATHSGTVDTARLEWTTACSNAVKIKFFRRVGDTLTMIAERGPFNTTPLSFSVTLAPPVALQQGDLIGMTTLSGCGNPSALLGGSSEGFLQYGGDVTGSVTLAQQLTHYEAVLNLSASGPATERIERVIPVVGAAQGNFGSSFKTEMQLFNPSAVAVTYHLIFRRAGVPGSSADTLRALEVKSKQTEAFPNIVVSMSETGLGSIDVVVPDGAAIPVINTRVYNDAGAAGASGLSEEAVPLPFPDAPLSGELVLRRGATGYLLAPLNQGRSRFNVGVRTLESGATIAVSTRSSAGVVLRTIAHSYAPHYFVQTDAATFTGGA